MKLAKYNVLHPSNDLSFGCVLKASELFAFLRSANPSQNPSYVNNNNKKLNGIEN